MACHGRERFGDSVRAPLLRIYNYINSLSSLFHVGFYTMRITLVSEHLPEVH